MRNKQNTCKTLTFKVNSVVKAIMQMHFNHDILQTIGPWELILTHKQTNYTIRHKIWPTLKG